MLTHVHLEESLAALRAHEVTSTRVRAVRRLHCTLSRFSQGTVPDVPEHVSETCGLLRWYPERLEVSVVISQFAFGQAACSVAIIDVLDGLVV